MGTNFQELRDRLTVCCGGTLGVQKLRSKRQLGHGQDQHGAQWREEDPSEHDRHDVHHVNAVGREYDQRSGAVRPGRQGHHGVGSLPPDRLCISHEDAERTRTAGMGGVHLRNCSRSR